MKRAVYYPLIVVCLILGLVLGGCGPTKLPSGPDAVWDLVVIGDSSLWGHGEAIAKQIEKDMGVKVNLEDFALPVLSAGKVREALETGKSANVRLEKLPEAVKNAEMVVMFTNPRDSVLPWGTTEMDACFRSGDPGPDACSSTYFDMYTADLKAIWQKIIALRRPGNHPDRHRYLQPTGDILADGWSFRQLQPLLGGYVNRRAECGRSRWGAVCEPAGSVQWG